MFGGLDSAWDGWLAGISDWGKAGWHIRDAKCVRGREKPEGVSVGVRGVLRNGEGARLASGEVL